MIIKYIAWSCVMTETCFLSKPKALWLYLRDATKHAAILPISKDKATLESYLQKWKHFKYLLSIGFFIQLLLPISYLRLSWQFEI